VRRLAPAPPRKQPPRVVVWGTWPAAWPAGARPVECSALSNEQCSLVCTPTSESTWGRAPKSPLRRGIRLRRRPLSSGQAPCARVLAGAYSCMAQLQDFKFAAGGYRHHTPTFRCARLGLADESLTRATKRLAGEGYHPHTPTSCGARLVFQTARYRGQRSSRLVLQTTRYRGQRSAWPSNTALSRRRLPPHTSAFRYVRLVLPAAQ
jgi:hypothetical protein